ncbi:PAS domain S-box protein [Ancylothrix sp. C2]|uniref:PAS domain S-box protein n=1 Tax=Ancylothrix sp. D3o TaxID=2953691 RepID=UPI0021BB74AA|nr:PAS domain S-box protein [Ancylothrix sp. D3o]MCT7948653.1 PAS domain S-box protein [Ancylothrix sp. D3o]
MKTNHLPFQFPAYALLTSCVLVGLLSGVFLQQTSEFHTPWLVLFIAVILSTWWGGFAAGLMATVCGAALASYLSFDPNFIFLTSIFGHNLRGDFFKTVSFPFGPAFKLQAGLFMIEACLLSSLLSNVRLSKQSASNRRAKQKSNENLKNAQGPEPSDPNLTQILKILENVSDGLAVLDSQNQVIFINEKAREYWKISPPEIANKKIAKVDNKPHLRDFDEKLDQALVGNKNKKIIEFISDSKQWFEINLYPSQEGTAISIQEITERKQKEQKKQKHFHKRQKQLQEKYREAAEKTQQQYDFLAEASKVLGTSVDAQKISEKLADLTVPFLGEYCLIYRLEGGQNIYQVASAHQNKQKQKIVDEITKLGPEDLETSQSLIATVLQTGEAIFINDKETASQAITNLKHWAKTSSHQHRQLIEELYPKTVMILPLFVRGQIWGAMLIAIAESNRQYDASELSLAENLAHRAAVTLENATLNQENQQTLQYQAQLLSLVAELYRQTQQALERKEELLSLIDALFAGAPVGIAFLDKDLRYIRINAQLATINGLPIEQHLGKKFTEVIPRISSKIEPQLQQVLQTGQPILNVEINGRTAEKPSREGYWLANYYPVRNARGETVGIGIILAEITQTKKAEASAKEANRKVANILESITDAFFALDHNWCFTYINQRCAEMMLEKPQKLLGRCIWEMFPDEIGSICHDNYHKAIKEQTAVHFEAKGWRTESYYEIHAYPSPDGLAVYLQDITERKQAYQALQESEKRFRRLVESNIFGVAFGDFQGGIHYANDYFLNMIGYSRQDLEAKQIKWLDITPPEYVHLDWQAGEELKQRGISTPFEKEYIRKDGSRVPILIGGALLQERCDEQQEIISFYLDLSDRKKAEKARQESEERFAAMFNQASIGIALVGLDGQFLEVNPAMSKISGYSQEELRQMNFQDVTHPDDLEADWALARQVINRQIPGYSIEKRYIRKNGEIVWVNLTSSALWDDKGQIKYGFGIIEDISERKQVQEALIESEERFRVMFNQAAVGIGLISLEGRYLQVNPALCEITGYTSQELTQKLFQELTHPDDLEADISNLGRLIAGEVKGYSRSKRYYHKNGSIVWVNISISAVWDSSGKPKYNVAIIEDISDRRRSELAQTFLVEASTILAASLEWETSLSNLAQLAIPSLADACFVDIFEETMSLRLLGVACSEPHKKELLEEIHRRYPPEHQPKHPILQRLRQGKPTFEPQVSDEMLQITAQDEEHLQMLQALEISSMMVIPLRSRGQLFGCVSFMRMGTRQRYDRADLALAEEVARRAASALDNARLYREAREANRLKDEFLAVLSHELRTPLNAILGWTQLLQTRKFNEATTQRALETIDRNARTQAQLIEDLLDVSRIITGKLRLKPRWASVQSLISQTIDTLRLAAEAKSILVEFVSDPAIDLMWVDPERFRQIVWNLLSNAIKFTPNSGQISVILSRAGSFAEISVTDTGIGIKPEFLPFVFDRFRQADGSTTRSYGGLGLGLAIVRHLVEINGGSAFVFSEGEGKGATFKVRLPFLTGNSEDETELSTQFSSLNFVHSTLAHLRILVVDDEPDTLDMVSFTLEQYGAMVRKAPTATHALEILQEWLPDMLLSDIGMPQVDGYMLIRTLRERPPEQGGLLPAIALTAYATENDRQQAFKAGFNCHLSKPVDPQLLIQSICNLLRGS